MCEQELVAVSILGFVHMALCFGLQFNPVYDILQWLSC